MKVPHIHGPDDLRLDEVEVPRAGPRDAVLQVSSVGICGTDLGLLALGGMGRRMPLGHELAGTVVEVGAEVAGLSPGDRVVLNPLPNMIGNGGPEGGFAERLLVRDLVARPGSLLPLPDAISLEHGALVEPVAVAVHALNRLAPQPGDKVAVFGCGTIGLALIAVMRYRGIEDIVAFDLSDYRRQSALRMGVRAAIDPTSQAANDALIAHHGEATVYGRPAPATTHYLEVTGAPILGDIIASAAAGSRICVVALHKKPQTIDFSNFMRELTVMGTMGYPTEFGEALEIVQSGRIDLDAFVSHRFRGDDVLAAFATAKQADISGKVLVTYD